MPTLSRSWLFTHLASRITSLQFIPAAAARRKTGRVAAAIDSFHATQFAFGRWRSGGRKIAATHCDFAGTTRRRHRTFFSLSSPKGAAGEASVESKLPPGRGEEANAFKPKSP